MMGDIGRKEPVTQCNSICSESVSGTKSLSFSYLSILVPACTLEVHLTGCPLSSAPQHPWDTWQHSWLHHQLVYSLLHICLLVFVLSLCCSVTVSGGQTADFAVLDPSLSQWIQFLLAVLCCPKLQFAVHAAVTDSYF